MDDCYSLHRRLQESGVVPTQRNSQKFVAGGTCIRFLAVLYKYRSWKKLHVGTESIFLALEGMDA